MTDEHPSIMLRTAIRAFQCEWCSKCGHYVIGNTFNHETGLCVFCEKPGVVKEVLGKLLGEQP